MTLCLLLNIDENVILWPAQYLVFATGLKPARVVKLIFHTVPLGKNTHTHTHLDPCSQERNQFGNSRELVTALAIENPQPKNEKGPARNGTVIKSI